MTYKSLSKKRSGEDTLAEFFVLLLMVPIGILLNAFVLKTLWNWFVPEVFTNAPLLTLVTAGGLTILLTFIQFKSDSQEPEVSPITRVFSSWFSGLFVLLIGFVFHAWFF